MWSQGGHSLSLRGIWAIYPSLDYGNEQMGMNLDRMAYKGYDSAENGFHIRPRGGSWQRMRSDVDISWMSAVKQVSFAMSIQIGWLDDSHVWLDIPILHWKDTRFIYWNEGYLNCMGKLSTNLIQEGRDWPFYESHVALSKHYSRPRCSICVSVEQCTWRSERS